MELAYSDQCIVPIKSLCLEDAVLLVCAMERPCICGRQTSVVVINRHRRGYMDKNAQAGLPVLLVAEGLDWIEAGGFPGGVDAEDDADQGAED